METPPASSLLRSNSASSTPKERPLTKAGNEDEYSKRIHQLEEFILSLNLDDSVIAPLNIMAKNGTASILKRKKGTRTSSFKKEADNSVDSSIEFNDKNTDDADFEDVCVTPSKNKPEKKSIFVKSTKKIMFRSPEKLKKILEHPPTLHKRMDSNGSNISSVSAQAAAAPATNTTTPRRILRSGGGKKLTTPLKTTPYKRKKVRASDVSSDNDVGGGGAASADEGGANVTTPTANAAAGGGGGGGGSASESEGQPTPGAAETLKERRARQRAAASAAIAPRSAGAFNTSTVTITIPETMSRRATTVTVDSGMFVEGGTAKTPHMQDLFAGGGEFFSGLNTNTEAVKKPIPSRLAARLGGTAKRTPTAATATSALSRSFEKDTSAATTGAGAATAGGDNSKGRVALRKSLLTKPPTTATTPGAKKTATPKAVQLFQWRVKPVEAVPSVAADSEQVGASIASPSGSASAPTTPVAAAAAAASGLSEVRVFVVHDNPQLSNTVAARLKAAAAAAPTTPSTAAATSVAAAASEEPPVVRLPGMQLMLESKGKNDQIHFMVGDIIFSGAYAHIEDANAGNCRGSECLILTNLKAVRHPIKQFQTRNSPTNKDIVEINMVDLPASSIVDVSTTEGVTEFFSSCKARVECILDPSHTENKWYPYFEGGEGPQRKMAPQFRSQGIGYIRLGDEFSNFGTAFLSLDAGATYLDNGATSVDNLAANKTSAANAKFYATPVKPKKLVRKNSSSDGEELALGDVTSTAVKASAKKPSATNASRKNFEIHQITEFLLDTVHSLKDATIKFTQRTEFLKKLKSLLTSLLVEGYQNNVEVMAEKHKDLIADILAVLLDHLRKQKNPLVMVAVIQAVGGISYGEVLANSFCAVWRSVLVETIHLLRSSNKQVYDATVLVLNALFKSKSITFTDLVMNMSDILSGASVGAPVAAPTTNNSAQNFGVNVAKVVSWLESVAKIDLDLCVKYHVSAEGAAALANFAPVTDSGSVHNVMSAVYQLGIPAVLRKLVPLLSHREEAVRDSTTSLLTTYLVLFILFSYTHLNAVVALLKIHTEEECSAAPALLLIKVIAEESMVEILNGVQKETVRYYDKIMSGIVYQTSRWVKTINGGSTAAGESSSSSGGGGACVSSTAIKTKRVSIASRLSVGTETGGGKASMGSVSDSLELDGNGKKEAVVITSDVDEV